MRALIALAAILLCLVVLFEAANRAPGRWLATGLLNGRTIDGVGTLEVEGVTGRLLSRVELARIRIRDADGLWLEAEGVELVWRGTALIGGRLDVQLAAIDRLALFRRPAPAAAQGGGNARMAINIERVSLPHVILAEPVLGRRFELDASAAIDDLGRRAGRIALEVRGRGATQDLLMLDLQRNTAGALTGALELIAPADGLLARAVGAPDRAFRIDGRLTGALASGAGSVTLTADGARAAEAALEWTGPDWRLNGEAFPAAVDSGQSVLPDRLQLAASGTSRSIWPDALQLQSDPLRIAFTRSGASQYDAAISAAPALLGWLDGAPVYIDRVDWDGVIDREAVSAAGRLTLSGLRGNGYAIPRISGPVSLAESDGSWRFDAEASADALSAPDEAIQTLLGATPALAASGRWRSQDDQLTFSRLAFEAANIFAEAAGEIRPAAGAWSLGGEVGLRDLALVDSSVGGALSIGFGFDQDEAGRMVLEAVPDISAATLPDWAAEMLAAARIEARSGPGETFAPEIGMSSEGVIIESRASRDAETGTWSLTGDAAFTLPSTGAVAATGAMAGAFDVDFAESRIRIRTEISTDSLTLEALSLEGPRLRSEIELDGGVEITARWWFDAQSSAGPFDLSGNVRHGPRSLTVALAGRAGPATAQARATQTGSALSAGLTLQEAVDEPRWRAAVEYSRADDELDAAALRIDLHGAAMTLPGGRLDRAGISASGPIDSLSLRGQAAGVFGEPFALDFDGEASLATALQRLQLVVTGDAAGQAVATRAPIELVHDGGALSAQGRVSLGDGDLRLAANWMGDQGGLQINGRDIPAELFTALAARSAVAGLVDLDAEISIADRILAGELRANGRGLAPPDVEGVEPIELELVLDADAATRLNARLSSQSLSGQAALARPGRLELDAAADWLTAIGWAGAVELTGDMAGLSMLLLPPGETLDGRFDLSLSKPVDAQGRWSGGLAVSQGRYTSSSSGTDLSEISIDARIEDGGLALVSASARDRYDGAVSGGGHVRWEETAPSGALRADFTRLRLVDRSDAQVTASGHAEVSLGDREIVVTGEAELHEAQMSPPENGAAAIPEIEVEEINLPEGAAPERRALPIRLDYAVSAPGNLFISARTFQTEWSADLTVAGPLNAPDLAGHAALISGQAFLLNRPFRLQSGRVSFDGPPMEAGVSLSASHQRPGFEARIEVSGTLEAPAVAMSSDPNLPQDEIFARLLFDRSTSSLSSLEAAQLAAQLSGRNLLTMVARLREAAGVDRLDVASGEDGEVVVTGGRRFGDSLYVEIETGASEALASARVEWSLTPDISILSRLTGNADAEVSVRWRTEYD